MNSYIEGQLADQRRLKDQQFQDKHDEIQGMIENLGMTTYCGSQRAKEYSRLPQDAGPTSASDTG